MERFNAKIYEKCTNLKRRKFSEIEERHQKTISDVLQYQSAMEELVEDLRNENDRLRVKILLTEEQYSECQKLLLAENQRTNMHSSVVGTPKEMLLQKNKNADKTLQSSECGNPAIRLEDAGEPLSEKEKFVTLSGKNAILSEKNVAVMSDCCNKTKDNSGDGIGKNCSPCAFHMLLELLLGMNFVVDYQTEGPHFSVFHQMSGYNFTLSWVREKDGGEGMLAYQVSSLGTIERIALDWMKEDIVFNFSMCPVFFDRLSRVVGKK